MYLPIFENSIYYYTVNKIYYYILVLIKYIHMACIIGYCTLILFINYNTIFGLPLLNLKLCAFRLFCKINIFNF